MYYLIIVSFIWAFSFGLIKQQLVGIDAYFIAWIRLTLAFLVFLPFFRLHNIIHNVNKRTFLKLISIGAIQYGIMYCSYILSYQYLPAYQIALLTIFTPLFVTLINDFLIRHFNLYNLLVTLLAVVGAGIIVYQEKDSLSSLKGFFLMQISNFCFAWGQVFYVRVKRQIPQVKDHNIYAFLFLGAVIITSIFTSFSGGWFDYPKIKIPQLLSLIYLGIISSGLCFFLWNVGALKVRAGFLAVINNLKIPLSVLVSLVIFGESAPYLPLIIGGGFILIALYLSNQRELLTAKARE